MTQPGYTRPCLTLALLPFLILILSSQLSGPAHAVCGNACKEAKAFCSKYEKDHPGEECGTVRGAICTTKDWVKIKQVNAAWSACRLSRNEGHHSAAKIRCAEWENVWGGDCQVHSPRCKAGWVKLGSWGKHYACRKADLSGGILYSGYRAFMRKFEGKAKHKVPAHLRAFIRKHYTFDPNKVRFGWVGEVKNATCITDCYNVYCDDKATIDRARNGYQWAPLPFHELQHVEQCKKKGSRKDYALYWFKQVPGSALNAIRPKNIGDFKLVFHDEMPMEVDAFNKEEAVHEAYLQGWWQVADYCRVYKADQVTQLGDLDGKVHPRYYCDPEFDQPGAKALKARARELAKDIGDGTYHLSIGQPNLPALDVDGNPVAGYRRGAWLGKVEIKHKILEMAWAVKTKPTDNCPQQSTVTANFATDGVKKIKVRIDRDGTKSDWKTLTTKKVTGGYLAGFEETLDVWLGPENTHRFRLEIEGEQTTPWKEVKIECPRFEVTRVGLRFNAERGPVCPKEISVREFYFTNGPGVVRHRRERQGGPPSNWMRTKTKLHDDKYAVIIKSTQKVGEIDQMRRVVANKHQLRTSPTLASKWVHFKTDCIDVTDAAIALEGPAKGLCAYKGSARIRFNTDMKGPVPYKVDCTDGTSWSGTLNAERTAPGTFVAVDLAPFNVKKTGKQVCALKTNFNDKPKNVALGARDYECLDVSNAALFIDGAERGKCPRPLKARVRFNAPAAVSIPYQLDCTLGHAWARSAKAHNTGPGAFIAVDAIAFQIRRPGQLACALKSKLTGVPKVVALASRKFECVAVAVPLGPPDLTGRPRPRPQAPPAPPKATKKKIPIGCVGGTVRNNQCVCRPGMIKRVVGINAWRCVANVACVGGRVVGARCICGRGTTLIRGRCVRPAR